MPNITNQTPYDSFLGKNLQSPSPIKVVADISGMYNSPLYYLISILNKGKSTPWDFVQKDSARMGNRSIVRSITAVAQTGNNLTVTYTATGGIDPFRTNWVVLDSNYKRGRVLSHSVGTVVIEPDGAALSSATDFLAATFIKNGWNASTNRESVRTEDLTYVPDTDYNYAAVGRTSKYIDLEDKIQTRAEIYGKYLWASQETFMVEDYVKETTIRYLMDDRAQVQGYDGMRNKNGGILWAVNNRGGQTIPGTAIFSVSDLKDVIMFIRKQNAQPDLQVVGFLGSEVEGSLMTGLGADIKYSGELNTFGGKLVKGLDVPWFKYLGVTITFMPMPEFNNPLGIFSDPCSYNPGTTRGQNSALFICTNDQRSVDGRMVPAIELFHRGASPVYCKHIPGMIDGDNKNMEITDLENPASSLTVSDKPGRTSLLYGWNGVDIQDAKGIVYWKG